MGNGLIRPKNEVESAVRIALKDVHLAPGILSWDLTTGVDAAGDPAVHITVNLRAGEIDDAELSAINESLYEIRRRVLSLDLGSFPYFRLEQAA